MANTRISDLTASASNLASTDLAPVVQTVGVGPVKMTGLQLAGGLLGSTTFNGSTVTTSSPVLNLTQTWDDGAVTFTGLKFNAAGSSDANSAAGSLLLDLQVGGASKFKADKAGSIYLAGGSVSRIIYAGSGATNFSILTNHVGVQAVFEGGSGNPMFTAGAPGNTYPGLFVMSGGFFGFYNSNSLGATPDIYLSRAAAATLQLGAADAAGSAIAINSVASNQLTLANSHGLSNGAAIIITGTAAPSGTTLNTLYYARSISAAVIELYDTYQNAITTSGTTGRVSVTTAGTSASVRLSTPFQTFQPQSFTGTDIPGQPFIIKGSRGTGTGAGGSIIFQVAPAGSSGTAQNAYQTAFQINGNGGVTGQDGVTANTLALRNGTTAQTFNVYNTYTDASNYSLGRLTHAGGNFYLQCLAAGSGSAGGIVIQPGAGQNVNIAAPLIFGTDNTYDIGAATTTRPRNLFIAGYEQLTEVTAPAAPAANSVRIYAEDNGSGKTRLMALFATGAAQQIAIEP